MAHYALEAKNASAQILPAERFMLRGNVRPDAGSVEQAAKWLTEARRPVVIVGDDVWKAGAQAELITLSERLALPVTSAGRLSFCNFPVNHPHDLGPFSMSSGYVSKGP